ncbi:MAG TPA: hypothetical protein VN703_01160, partial [Candidatus Sulfopaludibacter sp.]|nr:hypothetical protein [Candidatus Sulfopaludibacter sp.]
MCIKSIKTDSNGLKLIAAISLYNQKKGKPLAFNTQLFDYKNNVLRQFNCSSHKEIYCPSYKA